MSDIVAKAVLKEGTRESGTRDRAFLCLGLFQKPPILIFGGSGEGNFSISY